MSVVPALTNTVILMKVFFHYICMHSSQKFVIKNKNKKQPHIRFKYWYFKIYIKGL